MRNGPKGELALDVLRGAVAGTAGVWAMDRVDWLMYDHLLDTPETRRQTRAARPGGMDPAHTIAHLAARGIGVEPPTPRQNNTPGLAVHYTLGIVPGALYGALRGRVDYIDAGRGLLYGFGLFVLEDEIANPLMGTAAPPQKYPWQAHARGLVAHLVYGLVTDLVLRALSPRPDHQERSQTAPRTASPPLRSGPSRPPSPSRSPSPSNRAGPGNVVSSAL